MNWSKATKVIILVSVAGLSTWTALAAIFGNEGSTISGQVRDYGYTYPVVPFSLGFLLGHWFSQTATPIWHYSDRLAIVVALSFGAVVLAVAGVTVAAALGYNVGEPRWWVPHVLLSTGVVYGRLLWTMHPRRKLPPVYKFEPRR